MSYRDQFTTKDLSRFNADIPGGHVAILGAGAWGTAIAIALARGGHRVMLYARRPSHAATMVAMRENAERLPGHGFPAPLSIAASIGEAVAGASCVFLAGPSGATQQLARDAAPHAEAAAPFILCAKGLARDGGLLTDTVQAARPGAPVLVLSGPSFADEVAAGKHTIVSLSGPLATARSLCARFSTGQFVIAPCDDRCGVQVAGVFKNVAAILCGACDGLAGGSNARAALMSEAIREASHMVAALGGKQGTLLGPAGFGDFALTCTDPQSRNYRLGHALATGAAETATQEGAANAAALLASADELGVEVPLVAAVVDLIEGRIDARAAIGAAFAQRLAKSRQLRCAA